MEPTAGQTGTCVICSKPARGFLQEFSESNHVSVPKGEKQVLQCTMKLLRIKDWDDDISNDEASFCEDCFRRNDEVFKIMVQIDELKQKVKTIVRSIETDFETSFSNRVGDDGIATNNPKNRLRYRIATKLRLLPSSNLASGDNANMSSPRSFECDEYWSESSSGALKSHAEAFSSSPDRNKALKLAFGIKECAVMLSRLPSSLLRDHPVRLKSSTGRFKCKFADCSTRGFRSQQERRDHIRHSHSSVIHSSSKEGPASQKQSFSCIFADCEWKDFKNENERDAHVRAEHAETGYQGDMSKFVSVDCTEGTDDQFQASRNKFPKDAFATEDTATEGDSELQCIFADCDCSHGGRFPDLISRNAHLRQVHGMTFEDDPISVKSKNKKIPVQGTNREGLSNKGFKCIFADCSENQSFDTEEALASHVRGDHKFEEFVVTDYKKDDAVSSAPLKPVPKPPSRVYQCTVKGCKNRKCYPNQELYEMHMKKAHEGITHPFVCDDCGRKFRQNKVLQNHIKTAHLGQFPFICQYCAKGFLSLAALNIHLPKHTDERNYRCDQCPEAFKTRSGLLYHTRSAHTGERPFRCDRCGKGFFSSVKLTNHIKCVHNREERPCICHICGKGFPIRNYLYMHLRSHRDDNKSVKTSSGNEPGKAPTATDSQNNPQDFMQSVRSAICSTVDDNRLQDPSYSSLALQTSGPPTVLLPLPHHTTIISSAHPEVCESQQSRGSKNVCPTLHNVPSSFTAYYANFLQDAAAGTFHQQGQHN